MICKVSFIFVLAAVSSVSTDDPQCQNEGEHEIIPKSDCTGFYMCVHMEPVEMPDCPQGTVFSRSAQVCVHKDSIYDDCDFEGSETTTTPGPLSIEEQCRMNSGDLIAHPDECQAYYNCSHEYEYVPRLLEQFMMECSYPKLFNAETLQCEDFENVVCGERKEFKNGCDYRRNQCPVSHCIPCYINLPSCEGLKDGINPNVVKLWSPYYVTCYKERTMHQAKCPAENGRTQLFHPDLNECVPLERIPKEHGGMMPDCSGKPDGFYPDDFGRCTQYTVCKGGQFLNNVHCMEDEVFDAVYEECKNAEEACEPCGRNPNC